MNETAIMQTDLDRLAERVEKAAGLVQQLREDRERLERTVSTRVATLLTVLLLMIIFVTSAAPDVGPSLAKVIQAHL